MNESNNQSNDISNQTDSQIVTNINTGSHSSISITSTHSSESSHSTAISQFSKLSTVGTTSFLSITTSSTKAPPERRGHSDDSKMRNLLAFVIVSSAVLFIIVGIEPQQDLHFEQIAIT